MNKFEKAFHSYLRNLGYSQEEIEREQEEDNMFLRRDLSYSELEEIFLAGWEASQLA